MCCVSIRRWCCVCFTKRKTFDALLMVGAVYTLGLQHQRKLPTSKSSGLCTKFSSCTGRPVSLYLTAGSSIIITVDRTILRFYDGFLSIKVVLTLQPLGLFVVKRIHKTGNVQSVRPIPHQCCTSTHTQ